MLQDAAGWLHPAFRAPRSLRPWLTDRASLTARLQARYPDFRLRLLRQGRAMAVYDEIGPLQLGRRVGVIRRQVMLLDGERPDDLS